VTPFERPHARENTLVLKDVQVEVSGLFLREAIDFYREVVNVFSVLLLKTKARLMVAIRTGQQKGANISRILRH
jgi:hypothetical protein